jgi:formylglycine-generating enzyme required for sulfatase activity
MKHLDGHSPEAARGMPNATPEDANKAVGRDAEDRSVGAGKVNPDGKPRDGGRDAIFKRGRPQHPPVAQQTFSDPDDTVQAVAPPNHQAGVKHFIDADIDDEASIDSDDEAPIDSKVRRRFVIAGGVVVLLGLIALVWHETHKFTPGHHPTEPEREMPIKGESGKDQVLPERPRPPVEQLREPEQIEHPEPPRPRGDAAPDPTPTPAQVDAQTKPSTVSGVAPGVKDILKQPEMVSLPGAMFIMGTKDQRWEQPAHLVIVAPVMIGRFPVTVIEWRDCVRHQGCDHDVEGADNDPAANLSWADTQQYVKWLSGITGLDYRLPSEAEWEYAARAGTTTRYWWGDAMVPGIAACKDCLFHGASPTLADTRNYPANPFGLRQMTGAVAQWVSDCWHKDYRGAPTDGSSWDAPNCRERVLRGGSWRDDSTYLRTSSRESYDINVQYPTHGFRLARSQ